MRRFLVKAVCVLLLCCTVLCACGKSGNTTKTETPYDEDSKVSVYKGGMLAQNERFELWWDDDRYNISLVSKKNGRVWSTIPYEFYQSGVTDGVAAVNLNSPLSVTYIDPEMLTVKTVKASVGVYRNGRIKAEKTDNGIKVTYYFDKEKFSIPVEYKLSDRGMMAAILVDEIVESDFLIYQISLLPVFASALNDSDSYLFVPSGSGALINVKTDTAAKTYSEAVYGEDPVGISFADTTFYEQTRLPVFGVKDRDSAMLAVISDGAETAFVEAQAGDGEIGYSGIYASFSLRGYDLTKVADHTGLYRYIKKFSDNRVKLSRAQVEYCPVEEYTADYSGMAAFYRDMLVEEKKLSDKTDGGTTVALDIWGGALARKIFVGVPYDDYVSVTDFDGAKRIISKVSKTVGGGVVANLRGFGKTGLDYGKIGGEFTFASDTGGVDRYVALKEFCKKNGHSLFVDFDILRFSKSGSGVNLSNDSVKTANLVRDTQSFYSVATNTEIKYKGGFSLLARNRIADIGGLLDKKLNKLSVDGVGLVSLGTLAYSDFTDNSTYCKNGMAKDISTVIDTLSNGNRRILTSGANLYAAVMSDYITNTPLGSSHYDCIYADVPFYQMVFKGYIPMYSQSLNVAENADFAFLKAIESGIGLQFSLCERFDSELRSTVHTAISASCFDDVAPMIERYIKASDDYLKLVKDSSVVSHQSDGTVSKTIFENGVSVCVNFGKDAAQTPMGVIEPFSFIYGKE